MAVATLIPTGETINTFNSGTWVDVASDWKTPDTTTWISARTTDKGIRLSFDGIDVSSYRGSFVTVRLHANSDNDGMPVGFSHRLNVILYYNNVEQSRTILDDLAISPNTGSLEWEVQLATLATDTSLFELWIETYFRGVIPPAVPAISVYAANIDFEYVNETARVISVDSPVRQQG